MLALLGAGCASGPVIPGSGGLNFGAVVPLTGERTALGRSLQRGLELGLADVNAAGGVNGKPAGLAVFDGKSDLVDGKQAVEKIAEKNFDVMLLGDASLAVTLSDEAAKYPQIIGYMCDYVAGPTQTRPRGVRIYLNGDQEGDAISGYLIAATVQRVAILHRSDPISRSNAQFMAFEMTGGKVITYTDSFSTDEKDFQLLGRILRRVETEGTVLIGTGAEYPAIAAAFDAGAWNGLLLGYAPNGKLPQFPAGGRIGPKMLFPVPDFVLNPRGTDAGREFCDKYRAKYGEDPDLPAAYAYDNIRALAAAAAKAESFEPAKIHEAFLSMKTYVGAAGTYAIQYDGDTEMPLHLVTATREAAPPPVKPSTAEFNSAVPVDAPLFDGAKLLPDAPAKPKPEDKMDD